MSTEREFLNIFEAAAQLGVHVQTLRKMARQRKIPSFKVGRDWKFRKEALIRWADEQLGVVAAAPDFSVLVVDDDEQVCRQLSRMVELFGGRVRYTTRAADGLDLVAHKAPDLILLDLQMPDMNGPQFLARLRVTHPHLPVVIVTGYPDSELMRQAAHLPPLMLLPKPLERELLERTVRTIIGERPSSGGRMAARSADGRTP